MTTSENVFRTGIIPALAGNTLKETALSSSGRDHPRSRGEYKGGLRNESQPAGSSPLSRGIRLRRRDPVPAGRIIPALAGNTRTGSWKARNCSDHPRSRGEYLLGFVGEIGGDGSSPLSRGIPESGQQVARHPRIIPALAGNTRHRQAIPFGVRIIPALAGNTYACVVYESYTGDHPRSRGEYRGAQRPPGTAEGSSPLSRGILCSRQPVPTEGRIIPALAGNTMDSGRH